MNLVRRHLSTLLTMDKFVLVDLPPITKVLTLCLMPIEGLIGPVD